MRRQPRDQWCRGLAFGTSEERRAQGFLRNVAAEIQQQDQWGDSAPLDGLEQSETLAAHHRAHRRWLGEGLEPSQSPRTSGREPRIPRPLARNQTLEQTKPGGTGAAAGG